MMGVFAPFSAFVFLCILSPAYSASCSSTQKKYLSSLGTVQVITSPNYPSNYPSPGTCRWLIQTSSSDYLVQIKFTNFNTYGSWSCYYPSDKLDVYDTSYESSSKRLGTYCGSSVPQPLKSSGRYMYLKFTAYSSSPRTGFRLEISAVSKQSICSSLSLTASSSTTKILTSPNYPSNYPTSTSCQSTITAPSGYVVELKFTNFKIYGSSTGSCSSSLYDSLSIYDSSYAQSSKLLGKYCYSSYVPGNAVSLGRYMFLKFSSNSLFGRSGFRIEYKAVKDPAEDYTSCSVFNSYYTNNNIQLRASSSYKYIKSPYYPNKYPSNIQCTWVISSSSSSKKIKLIVSNVGMNNRYSYSCSSSGDSLTIRDGSSSYSTQLKEFCSKSYSSSTVTSSGQKLWIRFKTNSDNYFIWSSNVGFQAKFTEVEDTSTNVGMIVGIIFGVGIFIGLIVCCMCCKRKGNAGQVQNRAAAVTSVQTTTTTTHRPPPPPAAAAPQYPLQVGPSPAGSYPPPMGNYPKQPLSQGSYPPTTVVYPPGSSYPQQPQGGYIPPSGGSHPSSGGTLPPPGGSYPPPGPPGSYPPPGGSYPPPGGSLPQGGYPPPYPAGDVPDIPPPAYPGPPTYPTESNAPYNPQFQGAQANAPYPPPPQGSENPSVAPYPAPSETYAPPKA